MNSQSEKTIFELFQISIHFKGVTSLFEMIAGLLVLFISPSIVTDAVTLVTQGELTEDPNDLISNTLIHMAHSFAVSGGTFIGIYLLIRGFVQFLLVIGLVKNKLWTYPLSIIVVSLFVLYQIYQIVTTHSIIIIVLTCIDIFVIYFIWREYRVVLRTNSYFSKGVISSLH